MITNKNIPKYMNVLDLKDIGKLSYEKRDIPSIKSNEVLLEVKNCGICSSDIERIFINGTYHFPTIPGHEFSGEVVGVYDESDKDLLGKKAAVFPLIPCKECAACQSEEYAQCSNYNYFGSRCDGGYSEYIAIPKWNLVFFENMGYDLAALCEPAAVAIHSIKRVDIEKNSDVLIIGSGTIGLIIGLFAKTKGLNPYIGIHSDRSKKVVEDLGLQCFDTNNLQDEIQNKTNGQGFKYIFEAVGTNESLSQAISASDNFAKIVLIGNPKDDEKLDKKIYWKILRKQLTLTGTWNSSYSQKTNDWNEALKIIEKNPQIFQKIITHKYNLSDYDEAFNLLRDKKKTKIKVMFEMRK